MTNVFIDGSQGTTGLKIFDRLKARQDIALITLPEEKRKDISARKEALNSADIAFLCLPDDAAVEAVHLVENDRTVLLDTSTAHRTHPDWVYGFPELSKTLRERLQNAKRIAVPGCYAGGFIALVKPLIDEGFLPADHGFVCHAASGYSGAGKKGIAQYESENRDVLFDAPRAYALSQEHKHLKEMRAISGLTRTPIFCPYICDYYSGMLVTVPLFASELLKGRTIEDIRALYRERYCTPLVHYRAQMDEAGFLAANARSGFDDMEITVCGNDERILLMARYDNLGKGASGAALECMNIKMGLRPEYGLLV